MDDKIDIEVFVTITKGIQWYIFTDYWIDGKLWWDCKGLGRKLPWEGDKDATG